MKILIVVSSLNTGGAQRVAANLSMGLEGLCDVDFLLNEADDISYSYRGNIIDLGFKSERNRLRLGYQVRVFFRRLFALRELKRSGRYDAVCSFLDSANIVNVLTGKRYCKTILSVHGVLSGYKVMKEYRFIVIPLVRLLYQRAVRVIAVSRSVRDDLVNNLGLKSDNIVTVYNGFAVDDIIKRGKIELSTTDAELFRGRKVITAMGRLDWSKGFEHLIRIIPMIRESISEIRLIILGDGEDKQLLLGMIEELGLDGNVILAGFRENPFNIIKNSDVFVLSSLDEALPSVLIEALLLSVPCISTDMPGTREILDPDREDGEKPADHFIEAQYGIITPLPKEKHIDPRADLTPEEIVLAQSIVYLIGNDEVRNRYGSLSQDTINRFEARRMAEEWMNLIKG